jgi:hypothetical protein
MSNHIEAAQSLILKLNAPPQYHSVWVRNEVMPDGSVKPMICVSIRPAQVSRIKVPDEHMGFPVIRVPWPKGS